MLYLSWSLLTAVLVAGPTQKFTVVLVPEFQESAPRSVKVVAVSEAELSIPGSPSDGIALFDLAIDRRWRFTCESSELWCPEVEVPPGGASRRIELPIAKRVLLRGRARAVHPAEPPANLQLQAWAYLNGVSQPLSFHLSVPLEEGRFEIPAPASTLDLRIAGEGFSPVYLWDVASQGKSTLDLGALTLKKGNSLCGFIHDEASGIPLESAEVVLRLPRPTVGSPAHSTQRLERMTWTTETDARGFYQIVGPPAGNYRLEVTSRDPEHRILVVEPVGILAGAETCLEDLAVKQAIEVSFMVSPPWDPAGEPWQVRLSPEDSTGFVDSTPAVALDDIGQMSFLVSPGVHRLRVFDDNTGMSLVNRSIELENPQDILVEASVLQVVGSVRFGDEPVVAQVRISVVEDGAFTTFETDPDGNFSGWIRTPGEANPVAEIKAAYPSFSRWLELDELTVEDGVLRLDFNFEDRNLEGKVTDEEGHPVRKAEVNAVPVGSNMPLRTKTGIDGRFLLAGLAEKPYRVYANDRRLGTSQTVRVDPWGDGTGPELTLVLRRGRVAHGRLLSAEFEPVPGARVTLLPVNGPLTSVSTGMDGRFEFRVPAETRRAVAQVFAASQVLWTACVDLPTDTSELTLRLPMLPGGRILVRIPGSEVMGPGRQMMLLSSEGGFFSLNTLGNWARLSTNYEKPGRRSPDEDLTIGIPQLASGLYSVVVSSGSTDFVAQSCAGAFSAAAWQHLTPGGELSLTAASQRP